MKEPIKCRYPVNVLITFILTIDLMVLSDAASLRKHKVEILLSSDYVQMTNITVPPLGEFTWCLDLNRIANTHSWTAFSYAVAENNEVSSPELGLAGFNKKLELYYLENTYEVDIDLPIYSWHFVCSSWNSSSRQLDLYVNGSHIYNITTSSPKQPRANGTLVLGAKHVISGGNVDIVGSNSLLGNIYNFQMWNSKRPQETIGDCSDGNVVSWRDEFWIFKKNLPTEDKSLRCADFDYVHHHQQRSDDVTGGPAGGETNGVWRQWHVGAAVGQPGSMGTAAAGSGDIPSTASTTTRRTSLVTFFLVIMNITVSGADGIITEELALNLTQKLINSTFEDTDFAVIQFTVHDDLRYESKLIVQAVSSETSESLAGCLKDLLDSVDYTDVESKRNVSVQSVKVQRIENAKDLADHIFILTKNLASLSEEETDIILRKLSEIVKLGGTDMASAKTNLDILNAIMMKADNLRIFTNRILQITQEIGYKVTFLGDTANVTSETMAFSVSLVNLTDFMEIFFTVKSYLEGTAPEISQQRDNKAVAFVNVPEEIKHHTVTPTSKVQFNFFGKTSLFEDNHLSGYKLNTYVVSADVENTRIKELNEPVYITLRHIESNTAMSPVRCAYWDFNASGGLGGWDSYGCTVHCTNINSTTCHCSHLTHFGVLLDVSRTEVNAFDDHILSLLTYVGCGIASLFLGISLVTYMAFKPLRRDYPSKILMNLSCSLLMLNLVFLTNNWLSSFRNYGLCIAWAALLHYFLLASFTWMGLEAVHMYFAFVKVFNLYIRNYILKFCIAGWGIPVIVIAIVLVINRDYYGSESNLKKSAHPTESSELFCWIQNDVVFYVTVVAYFCVIFLANISMFIVVLLQINSLKSKKMKDWRELFLHDLKSTMSLAFLLGLTWGFVFFAWGPVRVAFLYLFSIFNTLQGFFIFVFHCLMKENVRKQWRMHLCCGRFRLDNCSDWSKLSNGEAKQNSRIRTSPSDSFQSTRSNTTASTSNSSSLSGFSREGYSGNSLGNGGIFMSSTPMAPPNHVTVHHDPR
ncbi:adhesion G-protein coupled receptor G4 [Rhinophrynus dorsalis]